MMKIRTFDMRLGWNRVERVHSSTGTRELRVDDYLSIR